MPWAVGFIGTLSFLAGLALAGERYVTAGLLIGAAAAVALWLRDYVLTTIEQAFERGAGYGTSTRRRIRELSEHEVTEVSKVARERWLNDD